MISIEDKARIIFQAGQFSDQPELKNFFYYNDIGVPLAMAVDCGLCELLPDGYEVINETWEYLCNIFHRDPTLDHYNHISDILDLTEDYE